MQTGTSDSISALHNKSYHFVSSLSTYKISFCSFVLNFAFLCCSAMTLDVSPKGFDFGCFTSAKKMQNEKGLAKLFIRLTRPF